MSMPKLKRIKVSSEEELRSRLATGPGDAVMIVTCNKTSRDKHVSNEQVSGVLGELGWSLGRRYTLSGNLVGHVARRA